VRFYLRLRERAQDAPALDAVGRWGLPPLAVARPDLTRYEVLAV